MRHLYNEDYSDLENTSSSVTIKPVEDQNSCLGEKDGESEMKVNNKTTGSTESKADEHHVRGQTKPPDDIIQSFSTLSGIAVPMATRFV